MYWDRIEVEDTACAMRPNLFKTVKSPHLKNDEVSNLYSIFHEDTLSYIFSVDGKNKVYFLTLSTLTGFLPYRSFRIKATSAFRSSKIQVNLHHTKHTVFGFFLSREPKF